MHSNEPSLNNLTRYMRFDSYIYITYPHTVLVPTYRPVHVAQHVGAKTQPTSTATGIQKKKEIETHTHTRPRTRIVKQLDICIAEPDTWLTV